MTAGTGARRRRVELIDPIVLAVAGFLLLSMGGAIVAAPLTVPLLVRIARRHPRRAWRGCAVVLAAATVAEVAWALVYVTAGETRPWIWLVPLVAGGAVVTLRQPAASAE